MLKAFIDDSGSGGDSPWFVLAGYISSVEDWDAFDGEWRAVLDQSPKIEYFKSSQAESLRPDGQWVGITKEERDAKISDLIRVVQKRVRHAFHVRVKQKHYNRIVSANGLPQIWDNAYYFLFIYMLTIGVTMEKYFGTGQPLEFVLDSSEQVEKPSHRLYGQLAEVWTGAEKIVNVSYRDEKLFLPLQASDLLAWQVRRRFCVTSEPKRKHFEESQKCTGIPPVFEKIVAEHDLVTLMDAIKQNEKAYIAKMGLHPETQLWRKKKR